MNQINVNPSREPVDVVDTSGDRSTAAGINLITVLIVLAVLAFVALACWRAYRSLQLQKRDPGAYEKEQAYADHRRRQRQMALGKVTGRGVEIVKGWVRKAALDGRRSRGHCFRQVWAAYHARRRGARGRVADTGVLGVAERSRRQREDRVVRERGIFRIGREVLAAQGAPPPTR